MTEFKTSQVRFWGPQDDGPSEAVLKQKLEGIFERHVEIRSAYLMVVDYGENTQASIALCLDAGAGEHDALREEIQGVFHAMFGEATGMDILFLTDAGIISWLGDKCTPFYQPASSRH